MAITLDGTNGILSPDFEPSSSTTPTNGLFLPAANTVGLATGSTERLRIDSSGNLGLGVTPSAWVSSAKAIQVGTGGFIEGRTSASAIELGSNAYINSSNAWTYQSAGAASYYAQWTGAHYWYTAPSGTAGNAISFTQAMTLDASGNLGIGTSSPGAKLDISGNARVSTYYNFNGNPSDPTDATAALYNGAYVGPTLSGNSIAFRTGTTPSERARIDSSGNLLVGTTSQLIGTGATITTASRNSSVQVNIQAANGAGYDASLYFECPGIFGATIQTQRSSGLLRIWNGAGTAGVTLSGAGTSWGTFSDERLKDIIEPIENAVTKVNGLRAVIAKYKTDPHDKRRAVLIAQDVVQVLPEAVYDDKSEEKYLSVAYTDTIPLLVAAIKELTARLEALEAK